MDKLRLEAIDRYIQSLFERNAPMLVSTEEILQDIQSIARGEENLFYYRQKPTPKIVITTACIPGNQTYHAGYTLAFPNKELQIETLTTKSDRFHLACLEITYIALVTLANLTRIFKYPVEVGVESLPLTQLLRTTGKGEEEEKAALIRELVKSIPAEIEFIWTPAGTTEANKNLYGILE